MTSKSAEPSEELRHLLRRIEEISTDEPTNRVTLRASRLGIDEAPPPLGMPLTRADGTTRRRQRALAAPLLFGAVAVAAAALAAAASLLFEWPKLAGGNSRPGDEIAIELPPPPASSEAAPSAPAGIGTPPLIQAGPMQEARVQTAPPHNSPKPTLTVPTITATTGQRVRVAVRIEPNTFSTRVFQVSVRGLPKGAQFVQGARAAPDRWVIPANDLGALELALGDATATGRFELTCELRGADGKPIAETRSVLVVTAPPARTATVAPSARSVAPAPPAASGPSAASGSSASLVPPETTAAVRNPAPTINAAGSAVSASTSAFGDSDRVDEAQDRFLIQGLRLLVLGNINSARLLFRRAADSGNARAALVLGDTFDDARLVQLGALGVLPDRDKAVYWYERADELGAPEAKERLSDVNTR
jgi:hypothetical protein